MGYLTEFTIWWVANMPLWVMPLISAICMGILVSMLFISGISD